MTVGGYNYSILLVKLLHVCYVPSAQFLRVFKGENNGGNSHFARRR